MTHASNINDLEKYFKKQYTNFVWENLYIFCLEKDNNGKQLHINFIKRPYEMYNQIEYSMCMTNYEYYIKDDKPSWVDISILGNKHRVLATLIYNTIFKNTALNRKTSVLINISDNTSFPNVKDAFLLTIDRTDTNLSIMNECPVCMISFKSPNIEKITLPCYHKMCKTCLFSSLEHKLNKCPLCRQKIIDTSTNV